MARVETAAAQRRLKTRQALGQNQRTDALGTANLVRGKRYQIGVQCLDIEWNPSKSLDRIDMQ